MAISVNTEVPEVMANRALLTGLATVKVIGLNPSKEQLEKLGRKPKEEPVYLGTSKKRGETQFQIDIYLEGEVNILDEDAPATVQAKATFWIENSTSYGLYIDKFGKFAKDASKLDGSARPAYNGEVDLIGFLKALCNVRQGEEISLDNPKALANGNIKEVQDVLRQVTKAGNQVQVLLGVREGKYQDVFKQFDYAGRGGSEYLHKQIVAQADYNQTNNHTGSYFGPINTLNSTYVPSQYLARKFSAEAQETFENTLPKGTFGQMANAFPGAAAQPAFQQPGMQFGGVPVAQPQGFHQQPQVLQPIGGDMDDSDSLPF